MDARIAMSFEEKSVWVQLGALGAALGAYFVVAGVLMARGVESLAAYVPLFGGAVIALVVLLVAGHALAAIMARPEGRDERDRLIGWRAESIAGSVLAAGVLASITVMIFGASPVWTAHALLLSLFASETVGLALRLVSYRRGV